MSVLVFCPFGVATATLKTNSSSRNYREIQLLLQPSGPVAAAMSRRAPTPAGSPLPVATLWVGPPGGGRTDAHKGSYLNRNYAEDPCSVQTPSFSEARALQTTLSAAASSAVFCPLIASFRRSKGSEAQTRRKRAVNGPQCDVPHSAPLTTLLPPSAPRAEAADR